MNDGGPTADCGGHYPKASPQIYARYVATPQGGGVDLGFERKDVIERRVINGRSYDIFNQTNETPDPELQRQTQARFESLLNPATFRDEPTHCEVQGILDHGEKIITVRFAYILRANK